jgi:hypothetical protein
MCEAPTSLPFHRRGDRIFIEEDDFAIFMAERVEITTTYRLKPTAAIKTEH